MAPEVTHVVPADAPAISLNPSVVCLYHGNCMDGLISAAIVHLFYKGNVTCLPISYKDDFPLDDIKGKDVLLVDFTFEPDEILPHMHLIKSLTIIDHHEAAMLPWLEIADSCHKDYVTVVYDKARSGAGLVWRHFFGTPGNNRTADMPILIQYAQEYDLWTKALPNTDEVQSGLRYTFPPREAQLAALGDFLVNAGPDEVEELRKIGTVIQRQEMIMVEAFVKRHLVVMDFLGYTGIPVCHMPAELANQGGELLYNRYPEAAFVVLFEDNYQCQTRKYSFRSKKGIGINVSEVAEIFGGKGHANSSGALVKHELVFLQ